MTTSANVDNKPIPDADIYLVGGAVRDQLLNIPVFDKDWVVVGSNAENMLAAGFRQVGNDFPVFLHPQTGQEYALARQERKLSTGHKGFETNTEAVSLEEDLGRRDLTINAMAQAADGEIIDPFHGREDLQSRCLRHVSDAFYEDPLRVLRVARFAAQLGNFNFYIAAETLDLLKEMSSEGELNNLTPERVWRETEKALKSPKPSVYFETLKQIGALKVILPEVDALFGIPQRPEFHPEIDAGLHTMLSLEKIAQASVDPRLRFAVLTHDLGKATTPKEVLPKHTGHEGRSAELTDELCNRLRVPNNYRKLAILVARHHLLCHQSLRLKPTTIERLLGNLGAWKQGSLVNDFTQCCMADARGRTGLEERPYPQVAFLLECELMAKQVSPQELLDQGFSGKKLGEQMRLQRLEKIRSVQKKYAHIDELQFATKAGGLQ